jgi:hypothetical protein
MSDHPMRLAADPLYCQVRLPHSALIQVLGLPVRFESNSRDVLAAVENRLGPGCGPATSSPRGRGISGRVRIVVHDSEEGPGDGHSVSFRSPRPDRLLVATPGGFGVAELDRRESYAYVSPSLVADEHRFQCGFVEALTLVLLAGSGRGPLHAATIAADKVGLLLAGRSRSGKSSLCYAAQAAGICAVGEDVAYLQCRPDFAVWTVPGRIHLQPETVQFFPELAGRVVTRLPNGKCKIVVPTDRERAFSSLPLARIGICLLDPGAGPARAEAVGRVDVERSLCAPAEPGFDFFRDAFRRAARQLAAGAAGSWRIHLSRDPREAVPILRECLAQLARPTRAAPDGVDCVP